MVTINTLPPVIADTADTGQLTLSKVIVNTVVFKSKSIDPRDLNRNIIIEAQLLPFTNQLL